VLIVYKLIYRTLLVLYPPLGGLGGKKGEGGREMAGVVEIKNFNNQDVYKD